MISSQNAQLVRRCMQGMQCEEHLQLGAAAVLLVCPCLWCLLPILPPASHQYPALTLLQAHAGRLCSALRDRGAHA